jgi:hypothetical protein
MTLKERRISQDVQGILTHVKVTYAAFDAEYSEDPAPDRIPATIPHSVSHCYLKVYTAF